MSELDPRDSRLLAQIRSALDEQDPVPPAVLAAARGSLTWLTVDAELAALAEDTAAAGAGVRSGAAARLLTFESSGAVISIEVTTSDDVRRLVGQVDRRAHLTVRHASGSIDADTDEHGRFVVDGVHGGPISIRCVFTDAPGSPVVTSWVVV